MLRHSLQTGPLAAQSLNPASGLWFSAFLPTQATFHMSLLPHHLPYWLSSAISNPLVHLPPSPIWFLQTCRVSFCSFLLLVDTPRLSPPWKHAESSHSACDTSLWVRCQSWGDPQRKAPPHMPAPLPLACAAHCTRQTEGTCPQVHICWDLDMCFFWNKCLSRCNEG